MTLVIVTNKRPTCTSKYRNRYIRVLLIVIIEKKLPGETSEPDGTHRLHSGQLLGNDFRFLLLGYHDFESIKIRE